MTITQKPSPNFDSNRVKIDRILIHWIVGNLAAADAQFAKPNSTSAHYGIENNEVHQYVLENKVAYHAGNYPFNQRSIGIEHSAAPDRPASEETYKTSGQLVREIAQRHGIPLDRQHIMRHSEVVATQCCGTVDVDKIIAIAKGATNDPRAGWFDLLSKTEFGTTGWEQLTQAQIDKWVSDLSVRKVAAGKWDVLCDKAGMPHTSTPDQVIAKLKVGCSPSELSKVKEEGRKAGVKQVDEAVHKLLV